MRKAKIALAIIIPVFLALAYGVYSADQREAIILDDDGVYEGLTGDQEAKLSKVVGECTRKTPNKMMPAVDGSYYNPMDKCDDLRIKLLEKYRNENGKD